MSKEIVRNAAVIVGIVIFLTFGFLMLHRINKLDSVLRDDRDIRIRLLTFTNEPAAKQYIGFHLSFITFNRNTQYSYDESTNTCTIVQVKNVGYEIIPTPSYVVIDEVVKECFLRQQKLGNK